jgi:hypothetical protein
LHALLAAVLKHFQVLSSFDSAHTCSSSPSILRSIPWLRLSLACALLAQLVEPNFNSGWTRTRVKLSEPYVNALLADDFNYTPCRNHCLDRETIVTHSLPLRFQSQHMKSYTQQ